MNKKKHRSERVYGHILRLYPKKYREEFGEEMKFVFSQSLKDAFTENGERGVITLWIRTVLDIGKSVYTQHRENRKGGESMKTKNNNLIMQNKVFLWIAIATGLILVIPLIAMQFNTGVDWDETDFIIMGVLLFGIASLFVLTARKVRSTRNRVIIGVGFFAALLYIWAELAVGIFTNWGS